MTTSNQGRGTFIINLPQDLNLLDLSKTCDYENGLSEPRFTLTVTLSNLGRGFDPLVKSILNVVYDNSQEFTTSRQQEVFTLKVTSPSAEVVLDVLKLASSLSAKQTFNGNGHIVLTQEQ